MNGKPINVLLVEDNPGDVRLLQEAMAEAHADRLRLVNVERLDQALKLVREEEWHVVLLDLSLPDAHGLQTVMRMHTQAPHVPIIVLTSLDDEALAVKALREGAQDYLVKGQVDGSLLIRATRYAIERKRAQEENRLLQEQLAHVQKMEAVGTLAGGIAHEFNNINAVIIGYIDLTLQTEELSDAARRNLEIVRSSAIRGGDLTKSLLAFARKDVGHRESVNLRDVVDEVLRVTGKEFTSEGIEVTVGHSTRVPPLMGDPGLLTHVAINLVINARHAMLKSAVKKLTIETGVDKEKPFIRVADTGCGIPKEDISRVFEPFFTTKGSLASGRVFDGKACGTGLGLSVCDSIVRGHGGHIKVSSPLGKGTTFTVYFPPASESQGLPQHAEQERKQGAARIIVVDDERDITNLLVQVLNRAGYAADGFTSPKEALKVLRRGHYSLAFIDLQMPDMTGQDFMGRVNGFPPKKRPLKVILTGRLGPVHEDYGRLDVFATLRKPFSNQQVLHIVEEGLAVKADPPSKAAHQRRPRKSPSH